MRILIVTDAWMPQVNGVVRTLRSLRKELLARGHKVGVVSPDLFASIPCPSYPEIRLALAGQGALGRMIEGFEPDSVHIATEGPLGLAARGWCVGRGIAFTTAYHTQFPEYLARRTRLPARVFWPYIRWFHGPSAAIMVSTHSVARQLREQRLPQTRLWGRGVDLACFRPDAPRHPLFASLRRPVQLYVGRVAVEKNIEAYLDSPHQGDKVVVGDGPARAALARRYPEVSFVGALHGESLASAYASADVFVFPSRTDTFGLVIIEALACGTPVAAFPVPGPADLLTHDTGAMDENLAAATAAALAKDRGACARYGARFSWAASTNQFEEALAPLRHPAREAAGSPAGRGEVKSASFAQP